MKREEYVAGFGGRKEKGKLILISKDNKIVFKH